MRITENPGEKSPLKPEGIGNFRDLGGIPTADGREVAFGRLFRSGKLSGMTAGDRYVLREHLHISCIVDLRNRQETEDFPSPALPGCRSHWVPLIEGPLIGITREEGDDVPFARAKRVAEYISRTGARELLCRIYPQMVSDPHSVARLAVFFRILQEHDDGAVLWHCTSGKDRTGVAAALLLKVLGAKEDVILKEYLATNELTAPGREMLLRALRQEGLPKEWVCQMEILESVDPAYLELCFSEIDRKYGSFSRFVSDGLLLSDNNVQILRGKYTHK